MIFKEIGPNPLTLKLIVFRLLLVPGQYYEIVVGCLWGQPNEMSKLCLAACKD